MHLSDHTLNLCNGLRSLYTPFNAALCKLGHDGCARRWKILACHLGTHCLTVPYLLHLLGKFSDLLTNCNHRLHPISTKLAYIVSIS